MNSIIKQYNDEKAYLGNIKIKDFPYLDLGKVLATQIWKTLNKSSIEIIKKFFSILFCSKYKLTIKKNMNDSGRYLLSANAGELRDDNRVIIENGKKFIEPCSVICLKKRNALSISFVLKKILTIIKYYKKFKGITNIIHRIYLAANMIIVENLSSDLDEEINNITFMLTFMDTDIFENYIVQTVQKNGGKVAALQHGQRFYIDEPCDSYVGMNNMTADYKLVWSCFSKQQYIKAGYSEERLPIIGSTKYLNLKNRQYKDKNAICVFLDGPFSYNSKEANKKMLKIVVEFLQKKRTKCFIKPHPIDQLKYNKEIVNNDNVIIVSPNKSIESLADEIDFGIVHKSGVSIDLVILGIPVLVFKTETVLPLELPENYFFNSEEQLNKFFNKWDLCKDDLLNEFKILRRKYTEENPFELHQKFFAQFGEKSNENID